MLKNWPWRRVLLILLFALAALGLGLAFGRQGTIASSEGQRLGAQSEQRARQNAFQSARRQGWGRGYRSGQRWGAERGSAAGRLAGQRAARAVLRQRERLAGGGEVLVVGDSLQVLTSPYLRTALPDLELTISAVGGYNSMQIYQLFAAAYRPEHSAIIFDAGTNDNPNYPEILAAELDKVQETIGSRRCLILPTIYGYTVGSADSSGKNAVLQTIAEQRPRTFAPDWGSIPLTAPELLFDDLHPNAAGAELRAELLAKAVRRCLSSGVSS